MRKQIIHISVHQTSKVIAGMHAAMISILFVLPTAIGYFLKGQLISGLLVLVLIPFFLWLFMYIGYVIACLFYNLVIPWFGGIEIELKDMELKTQSVEAQREEEIVVKKDAPVEKL